MANAYTPNDMATLRGFAELGDCEPGNRGEEGPEERVEGEGAGSAY